MAALRRENRLFRNLLKIAHGTARRSTAACPAGVGDVRSGCRDDGIVE
ncbi:MAG: hypothetical protein LBG11_12060 [Bifidobacteriaceae bacterium]|nr:hypothetical protein [Bifidobacteriaceae bacterium]